MKTEQADVFSGGEADNWFNRNKSAMHAREASTHFLLDILATYEYTPRTVLDVGCANGYLLSQLREKFKLEAHGVDISAAAIADGKQRYKDLNLVCTSCGELGAFGDGQFDMVLVLGVFCVVDRSVLFRVVAEIDRVLADKGILVISDFAPAFPSRTPYHHLPGRNVYTYKQDYPAVFIASNLYTEAGRWSFDYRSRKPSLRGDYTDQYNYVVLRKDRNLYADTPSGG